MLGLQAKQLIREADLNGDGKVSKEEFNKLLEPDQHTTDSLSFYDDRLALHLTGKFDDEPVEAAKKPDS